MVRQLVPTPIGVGITGITEGQARELAPLRGQPEELNAAWKEANEEAEAKGDRAMAYFTTVLHAAGLSWRFRWVDGVIYTDPFLLGKWQEEAAITTRIRHPIPAPQNRPWIENPYAVLFILTQLGDVGEVIGDAFPDLEPGADY